MTTIYIVRTANFQDDLYYETLQDALDFTKDQIDMGFATTILTEDVSEAEYARLLATMELPDGKHPEHFRQ